MRMLFVTRTTTPMMMVRSAMLLPMTVPRAMAVSFRSPEVMPMKSSGRVVEMAMMMNPIANSFSPRKEEIRVR